MTLAPGARIGPYEVISPIGAGGMGEVYRARDMKLNRDVALKVLSETLLDGDRLARFRREAQVVAALNHPNIGAIYGLEERGDRPALVLELVEGPTLADRLAQGPIPLDETVHIARQIAEALEAAHEQGIIHRDLKPANVKLRPDALVKVLDFGLAKLSDSGIARTRPDVSLSPTITSPAMTGVGVILGTAAYMAPEQAAGKETDKRADIWSFGVVLWEMLTGERLFASGETTSHVLADVLRAPIDFEQVPAGPLRELLRRCLDRDVKTRLRDMGEARVVLGRAVTPAPDQSGVPARTGTASIAWVVAAVFVTSTGLALWAPWRAAPEQPLVRLEVDLGANVALPANGRLRSVALSPDGTRLLYVSTVSGGKTRLYVQRLDDLDSVSTELSGTDGVTEATFSANGRSIAFAESNHIYTMPADGGAALRLPETDAPISHIAWADDGSIVVSEDGSGLVRLRPDGGAPAKITQLANAETFHAHPHVLPGSRTVLFVAGSYNSDVKTIEAVPLNGGPRRVIVRDAHSPLYLPTRHLLYLRAGTLFAVGFDPDTLETRGEPVPTVTDVRMGAGRVPFGTFSVATNGTLVYRKAVPGVRSLGQPPSKVEWIDATGRRSPLLNTVGAYTEPRLSPPDARELAMTIMSPSGEHDVAVYDPRRDSVPRRLSFDGVSTSPEWTPDGGHLVFVNFPKDLDKDKNGGNLVWAPRTGGTPQPLLPDVPVIGVGSFTATADGTRLAYMSVSAGRLAKTKQRRTNIFTATVTYEGGQLKATAPQRFSAPESNESGAELSPDGRWIAFAANKTKQDDVWEVWVRSFSTQAGQPYEVQMSTTGGTNPRWSFTTNELFYQSGDQVIAVPYTVNNDTLVPGRPGVRIDKLGGTSWDLARDGRIAVITSVASPDGSVAPAEHTIVFVENFADEVRRRAK